MPCDSGFAASEDFLAEELWPGILADLEFWKIRNEGPPRAETLVGGQVTLGPFATAVVGAGKHAAQW